MKLVAKHVKQGAQFTPQGVLRYPLVSKDPVETVLEIRLLLDELVVEQPAVA
jgi:transcription-repair coupling factor (superfamily II helicase)